MKDNKLTRTVWSLTLTVALMISLICGVVPANGEDVQTIFCNVTDSKPAICCDAGDRVDLTQCGVQFSPDGEMITDGISWVYNGKTVKIVKVSRRGTYALTASCGGQSRTVYVVAKDPVETEYVLYRNDFDAAPADFRIVESTAGARAYCADGNYVLDASADADAYLRVLLPEFLDIFGDVKIVSSMKFTSSVDNNKWASLMYRVQNDNFPYYQAVLRRNAASQSGIEISRRNEADLWNVVRKSSFGMAHSSEYNLYCVDVRGTESVFSVNNYEALSYNATAYANGGIGFQTRGARVVVDFIQVSLSGNDPQEKTCNVSYAKPAMRADMGDTIDLTGCSVQMSANALYVPGSEITWKLDGRKITSFTPKKAGVTVLTATASGITKKIYVVTRNLDEGEYVLYYNDFSTAPTDFRIIQETEASAYHDGAGRYVLDASSSDASYCRVLLPKFLDDFGDFRLDVICQDTAPNTERNWFALMGHVQNTDYPFLHLCVRNNAALSDGLEIAERTPGNKWDIKAKASSTKKTSNAFNTISMTVQNNIVKGYVNGEGGITYNTHSYMTGGIGLQAKGLKLIIDQVKITLGDNLEAEDAAVKCTVSKSRPAIGCNAGQTVLLSKCDVQFTYGSFPVKGSEIVWKKDGQVITSFSDTTVGLHTLTATHGHTTMNVYVVVKNATDPEYVLYYNDFTQGPTDYRVPETSNGGKVYPINGTFVLNGSADANAYVRVLLPSYLDQFGDADFYASVKLSGAVDSSKWASLMYRVQNGVVPYLQCSWRYNTNTSNGIELTERTSSGTWNVLLNSAATAHKPDQFNSILLSVSDLETSFSINGNQVIYSSSTPYHNGAWGFQVRGLTMTVDEVKLSFTQNENAMSIYAIPGGYVDVREPVTSITAAPALVTQVRTRADFDNILVDCPAVAIFEYDVSDGIEKIVFSDGAVTPDQVMDKLGSKIIPAFRIDTDLEADRLASFLKGRNQQDAYAVSTTLSVLKRAYGNWKYIRGVADFSAVGAIDAEKLRYDAMANTARVVIMPEHTTRAQVTYIQDSFSCVWLCVSPGKTASVAGTNKGPYGLVTPDRSLTESCYRDFYGTNTLIRRTNIIGHRGNLSLAPENTVYGTNLAYSNGANGVETDIYLSTDHVVIVMHDETLDRTTNGTGKVVELSSAQIKKYLVDYYSGVSPQPIPTLEDYFKAIKGKTDRKLVIEMKHPANADLSNALAALLQAYDISDQVVCISFLHSNLNHIRNVLPGAPAGLLSWLELDENNPVYSTYAAIENIQGVNSVCNPGYSGWGDRVIRQLLYRGVTLWPWTVNKENQFDALMMDGVAGITTDYPQWAKNYIESIHWNSASRVISSTYNDVLTDVTNSCEVVVIEDTLGITCSAGNIIVPENPLGGKATFYYRYRSVSPAGVPYYTVTEIRTIEVQSSYRFELKEDSALALNDGYLLKLTGGYTVRQLKDQFVDPVEIINGQGTVLSDGDIVSTGCQVYLQSDPSKRAIVVLRGDVNGDGAVNRDDNLLIRAYFYGQFDPQGVWFMAADCDGDGEITITDYLRQRAHYLTGFDLYS